MMLALHGKRSLHISDLYCEQQELTSPETGIRSPPRTKRSRYFHPVEVAQEVPQCLFRENPFDSLPDEIIKHIFKNLRKSDLRSCMATCRRFRQIASDRELWHSLNYYRRRFAEPKLISEVVLGAKMLLASHTVTLTQLTQSLYLPDLTIEYLDLTNAVVSEHLLISLLKACSQLKKLSLENQSVNSEICLAIAQNTHLDTLNLCMVSGLTSEGIVTIMMKCRRLVSLNVSWTRMDLLCLNHLTSMLPCSLKELNIAGYAAIFTDYHVHVICSNCPELESLCVSDNRELSHYAVGMISEKLFKLKRLDVSRCHNCIWPDYLLPLELLPEFKYLSCCGFPDDHYLEEIRSVLSNIQVNTEQCYNLSRIARPQPSGVTKVTSLWGVPMKGIFVSKYT